MNEYITSVDFLCYYLSSDVEYVWSYLKQAILAAMNSNIPKIAIKLNHYPK